MVGKEHRFPEDISSSRIRPYSRLEVPHTPNEKLTRLVLGNLLELLDLFEDIRIEHLVL
jgi:hypothetical protein